MAKKHDDTGDGGGSPHSDPCSLLCPLLYPVKLPGAHILSGISGHSRSKGKVGHHGKPVHPHDDHVGSNDDLPKAVSQRLNHNHSKGEDRLGYARWQPQV